MPTDPSTPPVGSVYWDALLASRHDPAFGRPGVLQCPCGMPVVLVPTGDGARLRLVDAERGLPHAENCPEYARRFPGQYPLWDWPPPAVAADHELLLEVRAAIEAMTCAVDEVRTLARALVAYTRNPTATRHVAPQIPEGNRRFKVPREQEERERAENLETGRLEQEGLADAPARRIIGVTEV